ncbi:MAG: hypothetical protein QXY65_06160 [Candidatus Methanomethylicaceae archaeon]
MISTLIFSMNRVENVLKLAEKLKDYVDEIVIIDSSNEEKFEELKKKLPFARIYWFPPLGMVELYYKIGLELCKGSYIFHLDDEEPSENLLKDLRKIIKEGYVFSIKRIDSKTRTGHKLFRLFHRDFIVPTGLIHWVWVSKVKPRELDDRYYIIHKEEDVNIKKLKKYAVIESWQFGVKVFRKITPSDFTYRKNPRKRIRIKRLLRLQLKLGGFGWFLLATEYNFFYVLYLFLRKILYRFPFPLHYYLFIQLNLFKDFPKKKIAWMKMIDKGVYEFLGLDSYEKALESLKYLKSRNGLENLVKLIEFKLQS